MLKKVAELVRSEELQRELANHVKLRREEGCGCEPRWSRISKRQCQDREWKEDIPRQTQNQEQAPLGKIQTIEGGFAGGGVTTSSKKAHARQARYHEVY